MPAIERLRQWIALPTIANMGINHQEGAEYMRQLALDAGFQQARMIKTDGVPAVFATLDLGAPVTLGIYFMYDVKHYDPAEWSTPPLDARLVERPGEGKAIVGRGAVNQKGPEMAFLSAIRAFKTAGVKLPVNLVLVAEGEEEMARGTSRKRSATLRSSGTEQGGWAFHPGSDESAPERSRSSRGAKGIIEVQRISSGDKWGRGPNKDIHSSLMASVDNPAWRLGKASIP